MAHLYNPYATDQQNSAQPQSDPQRTSHPYPGSSYRSAPSADLYSSRAREESLHLPRSYAMTPPSQGQRQAAAESSDRSLDWPPTYKSTNEDDASEYYTSATSSIFSGGGGSRTSAVSSIFPGGGESRTSAMSSIFPGGGESRTSAMSSIFPGGGESRTSAVSSSFPGGGGSRTSAVSSIFPGGGESRTSAVSSSFPGGGGSRTSAVSSIFPGGGESRTSAVSSSFPGGGESRTSAVSSSFPGGGESRTSAVSSSFPGGGGSRFTTIGERKPHEQSIPGLGEYEFPVRETASTQPEFSRPSSELARDVLHFGLEKDDLEELISYPEDQITPQNLPFILRQIRQQKTKNPVNAVKVAPHPEPKPTTSVSDTDFGGRMREVPHQDYRPRGIFKTSKVIDYGHISQFSAGPGEEVAMTSGAHSVGSSTLLMDSSGREAKGMNISSLISSCDQESSVPGLDPSFSFTLSSNTLPIKDPHQPLNQVSKFPDQQQPGAQRNPTPQVDTGNSVPAPAQMCDYAAITPGMFPHSCSLCHTECYSLKEWINHQNTGLHIENCKRLRTRFPEWDGELLTSLSSSDVYTRSSTTRPSQSRYKRRNSSSSSRSRSYSPQRHRGSGSRRDQERSRYRIRSRSRSNSPRHSSRRTHRSRTRSRSQSPPYRPAASRHRPAASCHRPSRSSPRRRDDKRSSAKTSRSVVRRSSNKSSTEKLRKKAAADWKQKTDLTTGEMMEENLLLERIPCVRRKTVFSPGFAFENRRVLQITDLPKYEDASYTERDVADLLTPFGFHHEDERFHNIYVIPQKCMAFAVLPTAEMAINVIRASVMNCFKLSGCKLMVKILEDNFRSPMVFYRTLMTWMNEKWNTLNVVFIKNISPSEARTLRDVAKKVGEVKNYVHLLNKVFVHFFSVDDVDRFGIWYSLLRHPPRYYIYRLGTPQCSVTTAKRLHWPARALPGRRLRAPGARRPTISSVPLGCVPPFYVTMTTFPFIFPTVCPWFNIPPFQDSSTVETPSHSSTIMMTGLPEEFYHQLHVSRLVWSLMDQRSVSSLFYRVMVLPLQRRAFIHFNDPKSARKFAQCHLLDPFSIKNKPVNVYFVNDVMNPGFTEDVMYRQLMELSNAGVPPLSDLDQRLLVVHVSEVSLMLIQAVMKEVASVGRLAGFLPLGNRICIEMLEPSDRMKVMEAELGSLTPPRIWKKVTRVDTVQSLQQLQSFDVTIDLEEDPHSAAPDQTTQDSPTSSSSSTTPSAANTAPDSGSSPETSEDVEMVEQGPSGAVNADSDDWATTEKLAEGPTPFEEHPESVKASVEHPEGPSAGLKPSQEYLESQTPSEKCLEVSTPSEEPPQSPKLSMEKPEGSTLSGECPEGPTTSNQPRTEIKERPLMGEEKINCILSLIQQYKHKKDTAKNTQNSDSSKQRLRLRCQTERSRSPPPSQRTHRDSCTTIARGKSQSPEHRSHPGKDKSPSNEYKETSSSTDSNSQLGKDECSVTESKGRFLNTESRSEQEQSLWSAVGLMMSAENTEAEPEKETPVEAPKEEETSVTLNEDKPDEEMENYQNLDLLEENIDEDQEYQLPRPGKDPSLDGLSLQVLDSVAKDHSGTDHVTDVAVAEKVSDETRVSNIAKRPRRGRGGKRGRKPKVLTANKDTTDQIHFEVIESVQSPTETEDPEPTSQAPKDVTLELEPIKEEEVFQVIDSVAEQFVCNYKKKQGHRGRQTRRSARGRTSEGESEEKQDETQTKSEATKPDSITNKEGADEVPCLVLDSIGSETIQEMEKVGRRRSTRGNKEEKITSLTASSKEEPTCKVEDVGTSAEVTVTRASRGRRGQFAKRDISTQGQTAAKECEEGKETSLKAEETLVSVEEVAYKVTDSVQNKGAPNAPPVSGRKRKRGRRRNVKATSKPAASKKTKVEIEEEPTYQINDSVEEEAAEDQEISNEPGTAEESSTPGDDYDKQKITESVCEEDEEEPVYQIVDSGEDYQEQEEIEDDPVPDTMIPSTIKGSTEGQEEQKDYTNLTEDKNHEAQELLTLDEADDTPEQPEAEGPEPKEELLIHVKGKDRPIIESDQSLDPLKSESLAAVDGDDKTQSKESQSDEPASSSTQQIGTTEAEASDQSDKGATASLGGGECEVKVVGKRRKEMMEPEAKRSRSQSPDVPADFKLPTYNPNNPLGVEFVVPKPGFFCNICSISFVNENTAKEVHCSSRRHFDNLKKRYLKLKATPSRTSSPTSS